MWQGRVEWDFHVFHESFPEMQKIKVINLKINDEKTLEEELNRLMNNIEYTNNGSYKLINDSKEIYNIQYWKNIEKKH